MGANINGFIGLRNRGGGGCGGLGRLIVLIVAVVVTAFLPLPLPIAAAIGDIRLALNQNQPLGNPHFLC